MNILLYSFTVLCFFASKQRQTEILANSFADSLQSNLKAGKIISEMGFPKLTEPKKPGDEDGRRG